MRGETRRITRLSVGILVGALALYTATLAPGLLWGGGDFATFQTMAFSPIYRLVPIE